MLEIGFFAPDQKLIPECFKVTAGGFGSGASSSKSSSHISGTCEKQASPGKASLLRGIKSSGTSYLKYSGNANRKQGKVVEEIHGIENFYLLLRLQANTSITKWDKWFPNKEL